MEYHPICLIISPQTSFMQIIMGEAWEAGWLRELPGECGSPGGALGPAATV